jgi:hypothetical protein
MVDPECLANLIFAQRAHRAVEVTLHDGTRWREPVGVADADPEQGWVDLYVAGPFGADTVMRLQLDQIAQVDVCESNWER